MALPTSGKISIEDILQEMQRPNETNNLDTLASEWYDQTKKDKFNNSTHQLSDWYGEEWTQVQETLSLSTGSLYFSRSGGSASVQVTSNTSWDVQGGALVSVSGSGNGNGSISVSIGSNLNANGRFDSFQVKTSTLSRTVTIEQEPGSDTGGDI